MKARNKISIFNHLVSVIPFNLLSRKNFYSLLLCSSVPLLFGSPSVASVTVEQQIAQVTTTGTINRPSLKVGSTGEAVSELQAALKLMGYYNGTVDGTYGQTTAAAVSQFKQSAGLAPDGVVDAATWQQLFPGGQTVTATTEQISSTPTTTNNNFPRPNQTAANLPKPVVTSNQESRTTTTTRINTGNAEQLETVRTTSTIRTTNNNNNSREVGSRNNTRQTARTTNVTSTNNSTDNRGRSTTNTATRTNTNRSNVNSASTTNRRRTATNTTSTRNTGNRSFRSTANNTSTYRTRQTEQNLQKPGIQYTAAGFPILRSGMRGEEVYDLQTRLQRLGYLKNNPDGDFGADTEAAVRALQQRAGLQPDGIAGGETWEILTRRRTSRSQS